jgi:hypothetical protein
LFNTTNSASQAQQATFVPIFTSDLKEAAILETIRRERTQLGGHNLVNYSASGPAGNGE